MHEFNADFYVAAATVLPVLYLALTLQGQTHREVMTRWRDVNKNAPFTFRSQIKVITWAVIGMAVGGVTVFALVAEYLALRALSVRTASHGTQQRVLTAAAGLLIVAAAGPVYWFLTAYFGTLADDRRAAMMRREARLGRLEAVVPPDKPPGNRP